MNYTIDGSDRDFDSLISARAYIMRLRTNWVRLNVYSSNRIVGYVKRIKGRVYWYGNEGIPKWVHRDGTFVKITKKEE